MGASTGQGSISNQQKPVAPTPGPPFVAGSAYNGLSIDTVTGQIVLGQDVGAVGDPAALVSNREIPIGVFSFKIVDTGILGNTFFSINPTVGIYTFGDYFGISNGTNLEINDALSYCFLGQPSGTNLYIDDVIQRAWIQSQSNFYLDIDKGNDLYRFGDINGSNTGTTLILNDAIQLSRITSASGNRLFLDALNGLYQIGDIDAFGNRSKLDIDDAAMLTQITVNGNYNVGIDEANFLYVFGDGNNLSVGPLLQLDGVLGVAELYGGTTVNKLRLLINEISQTVQFEETGNKRLFIDVTNALYQFGDITAASAGNNSFIEVDDTNQAFQFFIGTDPYLVADVANNSYALGDFNFASGGTVMYLDSVNGFAVYAAGNTLINFNTAANTYSIGDLSAAAGGLKIALLDATNKVQIKNTANTAFIEMNGVNGFTGTVAPVNTITVVGGIVTNVA